MEDEWQVPNLTESVSVAEDGIRDPKRGLVGSEMCIRDRHKHMRFYALQEGLLPPAKTFPFPVRVLNVHG